MRGEKGITALRNELKRMLDFIEDFGTEEESDDADLDFANDVLDTLQWVLAELSDKEFRQDPYLDMAKLEAIVKEIEERTGKTLQDQE